MRKILSVCVALLALAFGGAAQEVESRSLEAMLLDYNTSVTVKCPMESITGYATSYYHVAPSKNTITRGRGSSPDGRYYKHECSRHNDLAQSIYLARLEKLDSPDIYRHPLSHETEKIVYNFELITGIRNSGDGDFIGWCYISHQTRSEWKVWFNKNKDKLCYCVDHRVLYVEELPTTTASDNQ